MYAFPTLTLDLVVIASRNEQRLVLVEVHATDWAIMLVKSIDESPHAIVP